MSVFDGKFQTGTLDGPPNSVPTVDDGDEIELSASNSIESDSNSSRLVDQIVGRLQEMILNGEIPPKTPLRQTQIAETLGVSRTPLREALRILTNMGLITTGTYKRTLEVTELTRDDLEEFEQIRRRLDPLAARAAARNGLSASVVKELKQHLDLMTVDAEFLDLARYRSSHEAFHMLIAEHCGSPLLVRMAPLLKLGGNVIRRSLERDASLRVLDSESAANSRRQFDVIRKHHRDLLDAILSSDPDRAEEVGEQHIVISASPAREGAFRVW